MPPVWFGAGNSFLEFAALQLRQVRHHIYSSERLNTRATHIQCCPGQPGGNSIAGFFTEKSLANRVRGATASGSAALPYATRRSRCQPAMWAGPKRFALELRRARRRLPTFDRGASRLSCDTAWLKDSICIVMKTRRAAFRLA